jgi:membrane-bound inhibitor of C-type lysozyme
MNIWIKGKNAMIKKKKRKESKKRKCVSARKGYSGLQVPS